MQCEEVGVGGSKQSEDFLPSCFLSFLLPFFLAKRVTKGAPHISPSEICLRQKIASLDAATLAPHIECGQ